MIPSLIIFSFDFFFLFAVSLCAYLHTCFQTCIYRCELYSKITIIFAIYTPELKSFLDSLVICFHVMNKYHYYNSYSSLPMQIFVLMCLYNKTHCVHLNIGLVVTKIEENHIHPSLSSLRKMNMTFGTQEKDTKMEFPKTFLIEILKTLQ